MKVALILLGILLAAFVGLLVLAWMFGKSADETAATARADAERLAADTAAAAQVDAAVRVEAERIDACRVDAGVRPDNGEILLRNVDAGGA